MQPTRRSAFVAAVLCAAFVASPPAGAVSEVIAFDALFTTHHVMGPPGGPASCVGNVTVLISLDYVLGIGGAHISGPCTLLTSVFFRVASECVGSPAGDIACHNANMSLGLRADGHLHLDIGNPGPTTSPGMQHKAHGWLIRL